MAHKLDAVEYPHVSGLNDWYPATLGQDFRVGSQAVLE
jgi:hypothetical protein